MSEEYVDDWSLNASDIERLTQPSRKTKRVIINCPSCRVRMYEYTEPSEKVIFEKFDYHRNCKRCAGDRG